MDRDYLREASLARLTRKATEARSRNTGDRIRRHVKAERRCRPSRGGKIRKGLQKESKGVASRYFQPLWGYAAIGLLGQDDKTIQSQVKKLSQYKPFSTIQALYLYSRYEWFKPKNRATTCN